MSAFEFRVLVLAGMMGVGGIAGAQSVQLTASELTAKTEQMGQQTFKRKNGTELTFQQIDALPSQQRDAVLEEMTEQEAEVMAKWVLQLLAIANAEANEAKKLRDATIAKANEAKKLRDATIAKAALFTEDFANKIRQAIAFKVPLYHRDRKALEDVFDIEGVADRLKPETLSFIKSVLAHPELFRDK